MTTVYGILAQSAPSALSLTTAYTVPSGKHVTARVLVCNRSAADTFRIAVSPAGAAIQNSHYIAYDQPIDANDSIASAPFTVTATDIVRVYSTNGSISFTVTGIEDDN